MRRFLILFVLLPIAIVAIALSVANRESIVLSLDPFGGATRAASGAAGTRSPCHPPPPPEWLPQ